jgi:serine/threonine-protein kinase
LSDPRATLQQALGSSYTIERELGGGGMSRVYLAQETALGRTVVIKVIAPELAEGLSAERFAREVKLAARLQQANIVPVLTAGEAGGLPYYTMPYVKGESLRARLGAPGVGGPGAPPSGEVLGWLRDVVRALAYAHGEGVIHRDIKPENILLSGGTAVVTDFGIAKALSESRTQEGVASATITQAGNSIGTPAYMAPEQAAGATVDQRADLYAWGVVAYELLSGKHPFASRVGAQQMIAAHIAEKPAPLPATVAPELAALVMQCLAKSPDQRPVSADALLTRLTQIATTSGERAVAAPPISRSLLLAGAIVVLLAVAAGWYFGRGSAAPPNQSIVVLPFENLGAAEDAYFAEGVSDEIASQIARIPGMTVLARNSILRFKGSTRSPQDIATELGATYALSGTVRWARSGTGANGNTEVRIVPALVRSSNGEQVWGEPYQQKLTDIFQVQSDVAERVALALSVKVGKPQQAALRQSESRNPEARDAQMLGRSLLRRRGLESLRQAVTQFRRAIALDSGYAKAWAGYSAAYLLLPIYFDSTITLSQGTAEAERAARRAIALDSMLPEAQSALATALYQRMQFQEALATVDRALALDPSASLVYKDKAEILLSMGRVREAEAPLRRALELDPLVPVLLADMSVWYTANGQYDSAVALSDRIVAMDPDNVFWQYNRLGALSSAGRWEEAVQACVRIGFPERLCRAMWGGLADTAAHRAEILAALTEIRRDPALRLFVPPVVQAGIYTRLGEPDSAFARLREALRPGQYEIFAFINSPLLTSIKSDPRWDQIVGVVQRQ